jgi:methylated-DNA-[protein]-cysteine S-methyltransferase
VTEYCLIATAIGPVGLAWSEHGILRLQLPDDDGAKTQARLTRNLEAEEAHPPEWLEPSVIMLQRYFSGVETDLRAIPLDLSGVKDFFRTIYLELLTVRWGVTLTYGQLAERVGSPGAAQAVGQAMGKNPVPIIVPCHRVLASGAKLGGFSAPGGTKSKLWLLDMEGVRLSASNPAQHSFAF